MQPARKNGDDAAFVQCTVDVDADTREEYWTSVRQQPRPIARATFEPEWSPGVSRNHRSRR